MLSQTTAKYIVPTSNAIDPWEVVSGALADEGITTPRRAPLASLGFKPRHLRTAAGSDAAQQDLQTLAGWSRPTRRGMLAGLLAVASAPAAAALPTVEEVTPYSSGVPATTVSPRMAHLAAEAVRLTSLAEAMSAEPDSPASDASNVAIGNLVNERPATLGDLAVKLNAIAATMKDDCGTYLLERLAGDATLLVGEAK